MAKDIIMISLRDIDRLLIFQGAIKRDLTQVRIAEVFGLWIGMCEG